VFYNQWINLRKHQNNSTLIECRVSLKTLNGSLSVRNSIPGIKCNHRGKPLFKNSNTNDYARKNLRLEKASILLTKIKNKI